jgi:hypothetical protein
VVTSAAGQTASVGLSGEFAPSKVGPTISVGQRGARCSNNAVLTGLELTLQSEINNCNWVSLIYDSSVKTLKSEHVVWLTIP